MQPAQQGPLVHLIQGRGRPDCPPPCCWPFWGTLILPALLLLAARDGVLSRRWWPSLEHCRPPGGWGRCAVRLAPWLAGGCCARGQLPLQVGVQRIRGVERSHKRLL